MRSLYEELGVSANASPEEVTAAYRRRAKETHPDKGGKREDFQRVQHAYDVLSDDGKRRHYDETGDDGTHREQVPKAVEILAQEFSNFLSVEDAGDFDPIRALDLRMVEIKRDVGGQLRKWAKVVKRLEKMEKGLRSRHGQTILEEVIASRLVPARKNVARCTAMIRELDAALELLTGYSFAADDRPEFVFDLVGAFQDEMQKRKRRGAR